MKRFILPLGLALLALILMLGSTESRIQRASWLGRTVFLPFTNSLAMIRTNSSLKTEVAKLRGELAAKNLQNLGLKNQLKMSDPRQAIAFDTGEIKFDVAEVIGYSGQFHQRNLIVDKGAADGIAKDSPVISAQGIVGKVISVSASHCVVLPFSNPQFQIPVMDQTTSVQGILQSDLAGRTNINMIKLGSQISAGDTIVTSNLSTLFPKGFPVGTVSRTRESQDNLFISAELSPFALVENLEHVFILKYKGRQ
ncbi:MAG TPA: rod shape-determining protein MreC [Candidatus Syntrophosphaera sp.]|nr:rod shape-determining protein MreC [Candidatus Syntrophosphaera sp.]